MNKIIVKLGEIAFVKKGKKPPILAEEKIDGYIPYLDIEAFEKRILKQYTDGEKCTICEEGDIVIVWDGSRSGLVERSSERGAVGSTIARLIAPNINKNYLYYFLKGKYLILNTVTKGTGTPHVDPAILWNFEFPIVSMEMQNRIVEKIEELFSELDKAKEELQRVREQLKIYRQSVLKAAFEGKLTEEWRKNNHFGLFHKKIPLKEVALIVMGQSPPSKTYNTEKIGLPFYQGKKEFGEIYPFPEKYCSQPNKIAYSGDILISVRAPVGPTNLCREKSCIGRGLAVIRVNKEINRIYLFYYLRYFVFTLIEKSTGTTFKAISKSNLEQFSVRLFSLAEQNQIVQEIESRLSVCDKIEESVESGLIKIEHLRQSILKKAFEGKLVPQDPDDLPAEELLKLIKIEKEKIQNNSKKKVKR